MKINFIGIGRATIAGALLLLMSACTIAPSHTADSENPSKQVSANEYADRCGEQTSLFKHEIALCRSVPLITVPLQ